MSIIAAVIIPAYNEAKNLQILIPNIYKYAPSLLVIIVDDNSTDGTNKVIGKLKEKYPLKHLKRKMKMGRGTAVTFGFKEAFKDKKVKIFIEMDADLSHDPKELSKLISLVDKNTVVSASRYIKNSKIYGISNTRKILSFFVNSFESILFALPIHDYTNGYRAYPREAIKYLIKHKFKSTGYASISESSYILFKKGFKLRETNTRFVNRKIGSSKVDVHEMYISLRDLFRIRFSKI